MTQVRRLRAGQFLDYLLPNEVEIGLDCDAILNYVTNLVGCEDVARVPPIAEPNRRRTGPSSSP